MKFVIAVGVSVLGFCATCALADSMTIGKVADNVAGSISSLIKLLTAGAYMGGFALTVASLFKFKQHKDNPQQVQLGTCIAMLLIGVSLIFLPSIITTGGETVFGGSQKQATSNGVDTL